MRTFHENLDRVTKDFNDRDRDHDNLVAYAAAWVARLQIQNAGQRCQIETLEKLVGDLQVHVKAVTEGFDYSMEVAELKRKLDAANTLLHDKDVMIADLRKSRQQVCDENDKLYEQLNTLEVCNARQVKLLENSRVMDYGNALDKINSIVYEVLGSHPTV